ncbi:hypothetical protein MicloDRAFT_00032890 [Microvirga lotononidis]|uniref:Transcriptional regulator n=1 Tax=Microvirga lotononidis TaxID=864069 RepID=I4YRZ7_9HYPH|nr:hypothetical protein MicloDRAFT_00032890 [Microvirga lotononidis]
MSDLSRVQELVALRTALGFSQSTMAFHLELGVREYQSFEWGEAEIPNLYMLAAERIAIIQAVRQRAPLMVPPAIREEALTLATLMNAS